MLETLRNAFKIKDIRDKLIFTGLILIVVRIGCEIPIPGINRAYIESWFTQQLGGAANGAMSMLNSFTGGSFTSMSLFALNITPYITASIIMQLLTIAVPALEEMQKDGEDGRKKIAGYTRYLSIVLAAGEGLAMTIGFGNQGLLDSFDIRSVIIVVGAMVAGTALVMWLGERITENGIGNGISMILMVNILSGIPGDFYQLYNQFMKGKAIGMALVAALIVAAITVGTIVFVIILQDGERRIPVQYSKKVVGRKSMGGQSTHIPLKVNTAGVIPIIFASSILQLPVVVNGFFSESGGAEWTKYLSTQNWFDYKDIKYSVGVIVYMFLVVLFAYFYTSITFNPIEVSNNIKKNGGFVPGIRPGKPTSDYLSGIVSNVVFIGAMALIVIAIIPIFFSGAFNANVSFGGTSIIIIVGVILETLKQIESQMLTRHYTGFLNA